MNNTRTIVSLQSRIRSTCSLVDQLWVNLAHSFSAAVILCIGLLHNHQSAQNVDRQAIRILVGEALNTFDFINAFHANAATRMKQVIDILLGEEMARLQPALPDTFYRKEDTKDERLLGVVSKVVKVVLMGETQGMGLENEELKSTTHRPFYGILKQDHAEPNGVKIGRSSQALPHLVKEALSLLQEPCSVVDSTPSNDSNLFDSSSSFWTKQDRVFASDAEYSSTSSQTGSQLTSTADSSLIDMSDASDSFWGED